LFNSLLFNSIFKSLLIIGILFKSLLIIILLKFFNNLLFNKELFNKVLDLLLSISVTTIEGKLSSSGKLSSNRISEFELLRVFDLLNNLLELGISKKSPKFLP